MASPAAPKKDKDYYALLNVPRDAQVNEITKSYRKLALELHPDRTYGDEVAAERFKDVGEAYAVLSDPNRRRQYDLTGDSDAVSGGINMADLNTSGRLLGALLQKVGIPLPSEISQLTLSRAWELCQREDLRELETDPSVTLLRFGVDYKGSVERQHSVFFLLRIPEEVARDGLMLRCVSPNKSRFKLVMFDKKGVVRYQEEGLKSVAGNTTTATLSFAPFELSTMGDPFLSQVQATEADLPYIFFRLDVFRRYRRTLESGDHLVCIYGDNFLQNAQYVVTAVPIAPSAVREREVITLKDDALDEKKAQLTAFKDDFEKLHKEYAAALKQLEEYMKDTEELLKERDDAYSALLSQSLCLSRPAAAAQQHVSRSGAVRGGGGGGGLASAVGSSFSRVFGGGGGGGSATGAKPAPG